MSAYRPPPPPMQNSKSNLNTGTSDKESKDANKGQNKKKTPAKSIVIKDSDELIPLSPETADPNVTADIKTDIKIKPAKQPQLRIASDDDDDSDLETRLLKPLNLEEPLGKSPLIDYKAVIEAERLEQDVTEPFDYAEIMNNNIANKENKVAKTIGTSKASGERTYSYIFFKVPQPINDTLKKRLCEVSQNAKYCLDDKGSLDDVTTSESEETGVNKPQVVVKTPQGEENEVETIESHQIRLFDELGTFNVSKASTESKRDVDNVIQSLINKVASENGKTMTKPICFKQEPFEEEDASFMETDLKTNLHHSIKEISRFLKSPMTSADVELRSDYQHSFKDNAKIIIEPESFGRSSQTQAKIDDAEKFRDTIPAVGKISNMQPLDVDGSPEDALQASDRTEVEKEVENIKTFTESELLIKQLLDPFNNITTTGEDKGRYSMEAVKEAQNFDKIDSNYAGKTEKSLNDIPQPVNESLGYSQTIIGSVKVPQSLNYSGIQDAKKEFRRPPDGNEKIEIKPKRSLKLTQIFDNCGTNNIVKEIKMFLNDTTIDIDEPKSSELELVEDDKTQALLQTEQPTGTKIELIVEKSAKDVADIENAEISKLSETHTHSEELVNMPLTGSQESLRVPPPSCTTEENEANADKSVKVDPSVEPKQIELQLKSLQLNKSYVSFNTIGELKQANAPTNQEADKAQYSNSFPFRLQSAPLLQLFDYTVNTDPPDRPFAVPKSPGAVEVTATVSHEQSGLGTLLRLESSENLRNDSKVCPVQLATGSHSSQTKPNEDHIRGKVIQARKWKEASSQERFRLQLPRKYDSYPKAEDSHGLKSASFSVPMKGAVSRVSFSVPLASNISNIGSSKEKSSKKELKTNEYSSSSFRMQLPYNNTSTQVGLSLLDIQKTKDPVPDFAFVPDEEKHPFGEIKSFHDVLYKDSDDMQQHLKQKRQKSRDNIRILDSREEIGRSVEQFPRSKEVATSSKLIDTVSQSSASTSPKKIRLKDWTTPIKSFFTSSYNFFRRKLRRHPQERGQEIRCNPHKIRPKDRHSKVVYIESTVL